MRDAVDPLRAEPAERRRLGSRWLQYLRTWPTAEWLTWFDHRLGLYLLTIAAVWGLKWRNGYDLNAFMIAAGDVADGKSAYATTLAVGVGVWGTDQVYVSPPFVAHLLAPFRAVQGEVLFVAWAVAGLLAVALAIRALPTDALARRVPKLVFALGYVWATVFLGQVNLFVLAGLLLALGSPNSRLAGFGLGIATLFRGIPLLFAVELVIERRWRALGWAAAVIAAGVILTGPGEWLTYAGLVRDIAAVPTLDVPVQTSLAAVGRPLTVLVGLALAVVAVLAGRVPEQARLLRGTVIGLALVLLPGNGWVHWFCFALAALLVAGDRALWSRRAFVGFLVVPFILLGWPSVLLALVVIVAMLRRVLLGEPARASGRATEQLEPGPGRRLLPGAE
jgi:hypothetical protein